MVLTNGFNPDQRVYKEARSLTDRGFEVEILCWDRQDDYSLKTQIYSPNICVKRFGPSSKYGTGLKQVLPFIGFMKRIRKYLNDVDFDYLYCHDFDGLVAAKLFNFTKSKLIYDSHEYELERSTGRKSSKLRRVMVYHLEKFLIKKAALVIMVNDSIAEEVQTIYKLKEKPLVIRNMPEKWSLDQEVTQDVRKQLRKELNVSEDTFMVMYHGGISPTRGIEKMLEAVSKVPGIVALIMGQGSKDYIQALKAYTKTLNIEKRVLFKDAVAIEELWQFVSAADVGVSLAANTHKNHYYMLPNKLFENIQSLTPIIGSDFPEIRKIVKTFDIGLLVNPEESDEIAKTILTMKDNQKQYQTFKTNLIKAKEELHWGLEKVKLQEKIEGLL